MPLDVILASASPRRKELLSLIFGEFRVIPSDFDESTLSHIEDPARAVVHSSLEKGRYVASRFPGSLIVAADTVVVVDSAILGKPTDDSDAERMLRLLSGRTHQVYTGVTVAQNGIERSGYESTDVEFRELTDDVMSRYIATGEPMDKAGAYAIQGRGAVLIRGIRGCYFNVVGLPLHRLSEILEESGVPPLQPR